MLPVIDAYFVIGQLEISTNNATGQIYQYVFVENRDTLTDSRG
jgi:hypothetical protein